MDIDLLSKMVKELILDQDRVILPGLGSFVAEIVPSTFSDKGYTINPPYRRLYFRAKPDAGDDLVKLYSSSNNVKPEMAERIIVDFISELKSVLYEKKTVVFPGLGRLRATKENHLFFVADENLDIYPEGFGLEPISLKTHHETPEQVTAVVEDLKSFINMPEPVAKPEPEPEPQEEPVSEALPVEDPQPQPEPQPVEEVRIEPIPESIPEPVLESITEQVPELVAEVAPEPVAEVVPEQISVSAPKKDRKVLWVCVAVLSVVALMFLGLAVLGRVCPDVVDPLLYSPEDLKIVRMLYFAKTEVV
jgi:nucleoid DNA-binding protein